MKSIKRNLLRALVVLAKIDSFEWTMITWIVGAFALIVMYAEEGDENTIWYIVNFLVPMWCLWCYYVNGKGQGKYDWTKNLK